MNAYDFRSPKQRPDEAIVRVTGDRSAAALSGQRQLSAAIDKALADGKVSPELRGQVSAMMIAEGAEGATGRKR